MKRIILLLFLFTGYLVSGDPCVVFEKPEPKARFLVIDSSKLQATGKKVRNVLNFHPLCRFYEFSEKELPGGVKVYQREDITVKADGRTPVRRVEHSFLYIGAIAFSVLGLLLVLWRLFRPSSGAKDYEWVLLPVLLRWLLVLLTREYGVQPIITDESGYFQTISDMLRGEWRDPWRFTVGTGFFYLPFILILQAKEFYDIVPYFNYFSAFFLAPGCLVFTFFILRKLDVSAKKSCLFLLFWAIYPFVMFHFEDWNQFRFQTFALLPQLFSQFQGWFYYSICINAGFNAMSDTPGLFCVLGCLYFSLAMPAKLRYAVLAGALYGFSCLIRINYILLAPMFAEIFFCKFKESRLLLLKAAAASCCGFLAVFSIQMICNALQFGSPLTFGYILHYPENAALDRPAAGFTWHTFSRLTFLRYLFRVNLPFFALGTAALWCMRSRFNQAVLVLASVPVVFFFCGYSHTFCDARRFVFPAFAGLLMASAALEIWQELPRRTVWMIGSGLAAMILFTVPFDAPWKGLPFQLGDGWILRTAAVLIPFYLCSVIFYLFRKKLYRAALFVFLSAFLYYVPSEITAAGMFLLLPLTAVRLVFYYRLKKQEKLDDEQRCS